jgi:hypothetical protein
MVVSLPAMIAFSTTMRLFESPSSRSVWPAASSVSPKLVSTRQKIALQKIEFLFK